MGSVVVVAVGFGLLTEPALGGTAGAQRVLSTATVERGSVTANGSRQDSVLVVPKNGVILYEGHYFVNTPGVDHPWRIQFTPGAIGDDTIQVLAGLHEGQQILMPESSTRSDR